MRIEIKLPVDGFHNGILWADLADGWRHEDNPRIVDGSFITMQWVGYLINSSLN